MYLKASVAMMQGRPLTVWTGGDLSIIHMILLFQAYKMQQLRGQGASTQSLKESIEFQYTVNLDFIATLDLLKFWHFWKIN